jgi:hypothetical protein
MLTLLPDPDAPDTIPAPEATLSHREHVGSVASSFGDFGHIAVSASPGAVMLARQGAVLTMTPALARGLAELLERAAGLACGEAVRP